jgi:hypothetical protein
MNQGTAIIAIFFVVLACLVLWFVIGTKGKWSVKAPIILIVPSLCIMVWFSLESLMGWPVESVPRDVYDIIGFDVQEPNKEQQFDGSIYIWIKNMEGEQQNDMFGYAKRMLEDRKPRTYRRPYSRELHKQVEILKQALKSGARVRVEVQEPGKKKGGKKGGGPESPPDIQFHILPPANPSKARPRPKPPQQEQPVDKRKLA